MADRRKGSSQYAEIRRGVKTPMGSGNEEATVTDAKVGGNGWRKEASGSG